MIRSSVNLQDLPEHSDAVSKNSLFKIYQALADKNSLQFVQSVFAKHYAHHINSSHAHQMVDDAFSMFNVEEQSININTISNIIGQLSKNIYSRELNPKFFDSYNIYKSSLKPRYYFDIMKNDLYGEKILDYGSGKGYLSEYIHNKGYFALNADVLDYNEVDPSVIPFIKIEENSGLPKTVQSVDTVLCVTVLHHISSSVIRKCLTEISRITKRLVIIEDVIDVESFNPNPAEPLEKMLMELPIESRKNAIVFTDFYGNVVTQHLLDMNLPFQFKTSYEWKQLLEECGFEVLSITGLGFPKVSFHGFFQAKIVCDSKNYSGN